MTFFFLALKAKSARDKRNFIAVAVGFFVLFIAGTFQLFFK
jgi:hypothetical protein